MSGGMRFGIGARASRVEDQRFITGKGHFGDDVTVPGELFAEIVHAEVPAGRIEEIDIEAAAAMPGVFAVFTAADLKADGVGVIPCTGLRARPLERADGSVVEAPPRHALADGAVRYVGEPVAMVVAESRAAARDAAEAVMVTIEDRPHAADLMMAAAEGAPAVWDDAPDNTVFVKNVGDHEAVDAALSGSAHISRVRLPFQRLAMSPMEPRTAHGSIEDGRYVLRCGTQAPHAAGRVLAEILGVSTEGVRLVTGDMGGAFGMRSAVFPEMVLVLWAARKLGRPVKWTGTRSAHFLTDDMGRDMVMEAELGLDADGNFTALKVRNTAAVGAYLSMQGPLPAFVNLGGLAGVYRTPVISAAVRGVYTNTVPTAPYRGAGRPEAIACIELAIDEAARQFGFDRFALRQRNMIKPADMPFQTGLAYKYDCGDFPAAMAKVLDLADIAALEARRSDAAARGKLLGFGLCMAIESTAGFLDESASIAMAPGGRAVLGMGSANHGQGHETAMRQVVGETLGLPLDAIDYAMGDTDEIAHGSGTFGSRSAIFGGSAALEAARALVAKGLAQAAALFGVEPADVRFDDGLFYQDSSNRSLSWAELAAEASGGEGLSAEARWSSEDASTYPNGAHVVEVEIDRETGAAVLTRYEAVSDAGTLLNPMIVEGQIHGGVVQGLGQVFSEAMVYDASGQPVSASFMDYAMPRADDLCNIGVAHASVPTAKNPIGAKGAGEAGTVGALGAGLAAVADALAPAGVREILMPASPGRVWEAIEAARNGK
ncbi:xanthine dehydrogenase family protein molybdopterin-binding subunit [Acuticoccus sp. MNP-M23]|uniref:xanthine dehydrogenase family protein molybdopterin-binding subunit n=1 Tax=Acuticoccus sp. MNP-M23 TaxID=3072793 RepID=UPI002814A047|nr:xanthine dehydrogenase family protein molybdopterin-binding subunit [Acuticoccus sp. MNP-M23]WMS42839.1 xanthine dehydrogenase family protein molybdopterin-binding subunit [Acuticoccus sp. MNP-M23]